MEKNKIMEDVLGDTADLTTSDLYSADFRTAFRGYDRAEVRAFLERAADSFDSLQRQVAELRKTASQQKVHVERFQAMEQSLAEALTSAQKLGDTALDQARREADLIREEARQAAEAAKTNARAIPEALRDEIKRLQAMRKRLKGDLRAVLDIHAALLRGDGDAPGESLEYLPADGASYLNSGHDTGHPGHEADVSVIEHDGAGSARGEAT